MFSPPMPKSTADQARWIHSDKLFRIMHNLHSSDVKALMTQQMGTIRSEVRGKPDISNNLYRGGFAAVSVMYDAPGKIGNPDFEAAARMASLLSDAGFWSLGQMLQRNTLGMREMLVRPSIDRGKPVFRVVYPHRVVARARPQDPAVPVRIEEARQRRVNGKLVWTWEITDSRYGYYAVTDVDGNNITAAALGADVTEYPFTKSDGTGILPYSLYHAQDTGALWNTYDTQGFYEGVLSLAVKMTNIGHAEIKSVWSQRYAVGATVVGVSTAGAAAQTQRNAVVTDPSTVLMLEQTTEGVQPMIGQWAAPTDIDKLVSAATIYARGLAAHIGLNAASVTRVSGDPSSGYALTVNRDEQRTLQRRYAPVFARADVRTIEIVAVLLNRWHAAATPEDRGYDPEWVDLPEDGWAITYRGIPLSVSEKKALHEDHKARREAGTLDIVTAYMEQNPGTSDLEARQALERIRITNAAYSNAAAPSRLEEAAVRYPDLSADELRRRVIGQELDRQRLDAEIGAVLAVAGVSSTPRSTVTLSPGDLAAIVSVNEARAQEGLPALDGEAGKVSVYAAKIAEQRKATPPKAPPTK